MTVTLHENKFNAIVQSTSHVQLGIIRLRLILWVKIINLGTIFVKTHSEYLWNSQAGTKLLNLSKSNTENYFSWKRNFRRGHEWHTIAGARAHTHIYYKHVTTARLIFKSKITSAITFLYFFSLYKIKFAGFHVFSQLRYMRSMQWVEKDIILTFYGTATVSSTFLFFLG